jgi:hypothetical protein
MSLSWQSCPQCRVQFQAAQAATCPSCGALLGPTATISFTDQPLTAPEVTDVDTSVGHLHFPPPPRTRPAAAGSAGAQRSCQRP